MKEVEFIDIPCIINGQKIILTGSSDVTSKDIVDTLRFIISIEMKVLLNGNN